MTVQRRALVTGAASGIGAAVGRRLRADGWWVLGADVEPTPPDVADDAAVVDLRGRDVAAGLVAGLSTLDALVNNAATMPVGPLEDLADDALDATLALNLAAPIRLLREAIPLLRASRGAVVQVASVHARATSPGCVAYASSKAGLVGLTRAAALELGPLGIRVNAVLPGATSTPMLDRGLSRSPLGRDGAATALAGRTPLGRIAQPAEVAAAVAYLLGDDAAFVTGAELAVDGGALAVLGTE